MHWHEHHKCQTMLYLRGISCTVALLPAIHSMQYTIHSSEYRQCNALFTLSTLCSTAATHNTTTATHNMLLTHTYIAISNAQSSQMTIEWLNWNGQYHRQTLTDCSDWHNCFEQFNCTQLSTALHSSPQRPQSPHSSLDYRRNRHFKQWAYYRIIVLS